MRYGRSRAAADAEVAYYHCFSRVVDKRFALGDLEKERFVKFMRAYEEFCGVRIVTFCVMSNHFHLLVEVPHRPAPELLPTDEELVRLVKVADCSY
ncbi:MAG: transposase, partial [Chthoniobacteraceae bacterium]|nr:transposase [Chthoniobacteraceae bacterium]